MTWRHRKLSSRRRRVERLEAARDPEACTCGKTRVVYENDWRDDPPDPGPEICETCGRAVPTTVVRWVDKWRTKD